jgi:hypothetical protein
MPLHWDISHADRLVTVRAEGVISLREMEAYLDALITSDAMPYAKLFDASKIEPDYTDHDMMMLGARIRAYVSVVKGGPLAFVASSREQREAIAHYLRLAAVEDRPVAVFRVVDEARAWLVGQLRRIASR